MTAFLKVYLLEKQIDEKRVQCERSSLLTALVHKMSPEDMKVLMQQAVAYRTGRMGDAEFYAALQGLCAMHQISLDATPALKQFMEYVQLSQTINGRDLMAELSLCENVGYEQLLKTSEEKKLYSQIYDLELKKKLVHYLRL